MGGSDSVDNSRKLAKKMNKNIVNVSGEFQTVVENEKDNFAVYLRVRLNNGNSA